MKQIGFASISPNLSYACKFDLSSWIHTALGGLKDSLFLSSSVSSTSSRFPPLVMSGWRTPRRLTAPARCLSSTSASPVGPAGEEPRPGSCSPAACRSSVTSTPRIRAAAGSTQRQPDHAASPSQGQVPCQASQAHQTPSLAPVCEPAPSSPSTGSSPLAVPLLRPTAGLHPAAQHPGVTVGKGRTPQGVGSSGREQQQQQRSVFLRGRGCSLSIIAGLTYKKTNTILFFALAFSV